MTLKILRQPLYIVFTLFVLGSCGANIKAVQTQPALAPGAGLHMHDTSAFKAWVTAFKQEALAKGISQAVVDNAFADITAPSDEVLQRDQTQPEKTKTFAMYIKGFTSEKKVDAAREQWQSHASVLKEIEKAYGVPAPILLALWQTESRFGESQGSFSIVESLATLAYDGRRSAFFRKELLNALLILQQEHMDPHALTGSWAGAMGQVQFMPSSFLAFAVDFDGDGKKDIWNNDADALASMANYLHTKGWDETMGWGFHVRLPLTDNIPAWAASHEGASLKQWQKRGLRRSNGAKLPNLPYNMRLVVTDADTSDGYLVTSNYDVIMDWNHSIYFATAVNLLADAIVKQ
jgi:membrane-bound lytic murein transglycosylase B